jgi:retron-type reverse transcriptase
MPYTNLLRTNFRQADIDAHVGPAKDFLERHQLAAAMVQTGERTLEEFLPDLVKRIADTRNLRMAWGYLSRHGGAAPGPNGMTYADLELFAVWELLRRIESSILQGRYVPGPVKAQVVSKGSGRGMRTLSLMNIEDRVVQRGIVQIIQPLLDPQFDAHSFGGRPGRSPFEALARADALMQAHGLTVWITEDIRNAFDMVPLGRLLDIIRKRLPNLEFVPLVARVIREDQRKGLLQGGPLSPLLMNLYLDHFLDRVWRQLHPDIPLLRFIDDILILCRPMDDPRALHAELQQLLQRAAMPLKGTAETAMHDLTHGQRADWLGFELTLGREGMEVRLLLSEQRGKWFDHLRENLLLSHEKTDSPFRASQVILGQIRQAGPCYLTTDREGLYATTREVAREMGFEEIPSFGEFQIAWNEGNQRWCDLRQSAAREFLSE